MLSWIDGWLASLRSSLIISGQLESDNVCQGGLFAIVTVSPLP